MSGAHAHGASGRHVVIECPAEVGDTCPGPDKKGWLRWEINPVYITILASLIVSLLVWGGGPNGVNAHFSSLDTIVKQQDKDVTRLDDKIKEADLRVDKRLESMERKMDEMSKKMDRFIERGR